MKVTSDVPDILHSFMSLIKCSCVIKKKVLMRLENVMPPATAVVSTGAYKCCEYWKPLRCDLPTSSLSSAWMKRGRAKPTCASSVMRTRYSELLNFGALSFLSINRMVKVVTTVALDGLRSSFSSVA